MVNHIKDIIQTFVNTEQKWHTKLLALWPTIAGHLQNKVRIEKIDKHTLTLGVYDSNWLHELYMLKPLLLENINNQLGQPYIQNLHFKQVIKKAETVTKKPNYSPSAPKSIILSIKEKAALEKIKDAELKNALIKFLGRL